MSSTFSAYPAIVGVSGASQNDSLNLSITNVNDSNYKNVAQAFGANTVTLAASTSFPAAYVTGLQIKTFEPITFASQTRTITAYDSLTKVATVSPAWSSPLPTISGFYVIDQPISISSSNNNLTTAGILEIQNYGPGNRLTTIGGALNIPNLNSVLSVTNVMGQDADGYIHKFSPATLLQNAVKSAFRDGSITFTNPGTTTYTVNFTNWGTGPQNFISAGSRKFKGSIELEFSTADGTASNAWTLQFLDTSGSPITPNFYNTTMVNTNAGNAAGTITQIGATSASSGLVSRAGYQSGAHLFGFTYELDISNFEPNQNGHCIRFSTAYEAAGTLTTSIERCAGTIWLYGTNIDIGGFVLTQTSSGGTPATLSSLYKEYVEHS